MLKDAQGSFFTLPWCTAFPAAVVILLILGVGLVGEGLRERMFRNSPRTSRAKLGMKSTPA